MTQDRDSRYGHAIDRDVYGDWRWTLLDANDQGHMVDKLRRVAELLIDAIKEVTLRPLQAQIDSPLLDMIGGSVNVDLLDGLSKDIRACWSELVCCVEYIAGSPKKSAAERLRLLDVLDIALPNETRLGGNSDFALPSLPRQMPLPATDAEALSFLQLAVELRSLQQRLNIQANQDEQARTEAFDDRARYIGSGQWNLSPNPLLERQANADVAEARKLVRTQTLRLRGQAEYKVLHGVAEAVTRSLRLLRFASSSARKSL